MSFADHVFENTPFDDVYIFDVHAHTDSYAPFQLGDPTADGLAFTCKRLGVDGLVTSSLTACRSDWEFGNGLTADACAAYPGYIFGYAVPNPYDSDCSLERYFEKDMGFRGIKVHGDMQGSLPLNDPRYFPAYELAAKLGIPVLFHAWLPSEVNAAVDVAKRWPTVPIILGHAGMTAKPAAAQAAKTCSNIFIDTAVSSTIDGSVEWLVNNIGVDQVLYGSDCTFFDCVHTLGKIALARITDDEKEKILGLNARKLFRV